MGIPHDTLFVYRFDRPVGRIYGPRPLSWVVAAYGGSPECECAPFDATGTQASGPWRSVPGWHAEMLPVPPPPVTDRQRVRLANLKVLAIPVTKEEAAQLIHEAESRLKPTKGQLSKVRTLKIAVTPGSSRGEVEALVDMAERQKAILSLRRQNLEIEGGASWDEIQTAEEEAEERREARPLAAALRRRGVAAMDDMSLEELEELDQARQDLDQAIVEARGMGFRFEPPPGLTLESMQSLYASLGDLEQHFGVSESNLELLVHRGDLPRKPRKAAIKAALPELLARIHAGTWQGSEEDDLWFFRRALELQARRA